MVDMERALRLFEEGYNVSQSMLCAFCGETGLTEEQSRKLGTGFGGRSRYSGESCGVITTGVMVLGLIHGYSDDNDNASKERFRDKVGEFLAEFEARNGSLYCEKLPGMDVQTKKGWDKACEQKMLNDVCTHFLKDAIEIVAMLVK